MATVDEILAAANQGKKDHDAEKPPDPINFLTGILTLGFVDPNSTYSPPASDDPAILEAYNKAWNNDK